MTLLTTVYKILSKSLAERLKYHLHSVVDKDKTYCIPDRSAFDNLFLVPDVLETSERTADLIEKRFVQEKAFDRVHHTYLFKVIKAFCFGGTLLNWVKLLCTEASCMVKVEGGLSRPLSVSWGRLSIVWSVICFSSRTTTVLS